MSSSFYFINCSRQYLFVPLNLQKDGTLYASIGLLLITLLPIITMNIYIIGRTYFCKSMHSPANFLLASTSLWDLLTGIFSILPWVIVLIMTFSRTHSCALFLFATFSAHSFGLISFLTLTLSSIDRYVAVFQPFFYEKYVNDNPCLYIKCVSFITGIVLLINGLSFLTQNRNLIELVIIFVSPILILIVLYIHTRLHFRVQTVRRMITAQRPNLDASDETKNEQNVKKNDLAPKKRVNKGVKMNKLTLMIHFSTCIAYLPYNTVICLWHFKRLTYSWEWTHTFYLWGCTLTCTKSLANPIIFFYRSSVLRGSIGRIWQSRS